MDTIHYGLGQIGRQILALALRPGAGRVRGAVDIDPDTVGRDLGTLAGGPAAGIQVVETLAEIADLSGKVTALHATGSRLPQVWPQLRQLLDAGAPVVSTCEELAYPWHRHPELAREIDDYARQRGLTVLGTGVNPGFVMDVLPLAVTAVVGEVHGVRVSRVVDVSLRRVQLQRKVGVGLDRDTFTRLAAAGEVGHVGLEESARLLAYGLGWSLEQVETSIAPTVATREHRLAAGALAAGQVDGLAQSCLATAAGGRRIELQLTMRVEAEQRDDITVTGDRELHLAVPDGVAGDSGTAAIAVSCANRVRALPAGLLTMADAGLGATRIAEE